MAKSDRARIDASERPEHEDSSPERQDIAIIGIGCRLPGGANSPEALWELLVEERDAIGHPPKDRWEPDAFDDPALTAAGKSVPPWGGYLDDVAGFDADFFGVAQREADVLDPQHRLLLEVGWESLDHAGLPADRLADTATGVFTGLSYTDYMDRLAGRPEELEGSILTNGTCVASGRFSYLLGLQGPSLSVDTACSSSLVAVHLACQSLRTGECTVALAGGVTLMLWPRVTKSFVRMGMLSPTGRCHAFDAAADGFVRGEGAGMVVLKRLIDAERDGDRVLAVIRGSAVNQDGRTNGLAVPSADAQYAVATAALREAQVDPADVGLVEAHGTGTPVGDPLEFAALARAYGRGEANCALGSVKTNLGHLEPASGIAGLIKAVLCLQHGQVPANLHFDRWNPDIDARDSRFFVPAALTAWPGAAATRLAAVSSFGFSGTNAHVVLEQAPVRADIPRPTATGRSQGPEVLLLPAGSSAMLPAAAEQLADWLEASPASDPSTATTTSATSDPSDTSVSDVAYTLSRRRSFGRGRLGVVGSDRTELIRELRSFAGGQSSANVVFGTATPGVRRDTVWVFSGQGSQWAGMGRDLLGTEPSFAATLAELDPLILAESGFSVLQLLRRGEAVSGCGRVQPMIFAMQLALAAMWRAHGVEPAGVIGHSMGEVAAAVVAGALTVEDGVRVICRRSQLLTRIAGAGAMATISLGHQAVEAELAAEGLSDDVAVAVLAAPDSTVVAGTRETVEDLVARWDARGIASHLIAVDVASHSPQVEPLLEDLSATLSGLRPARPSLRFYSTVLSDVAGRPGFDAAYWCENLRRPVRFTDAVTAAATDGHRVFIEIAPHPVVARSITRLLAGGPREPVVLPTLRRDETGQDVFRAQLAAAHCVGVAVDWSVLYPDGELVDVPGLRFDRKRHWVDISSPSGFGQDGATASEVASRPGQPLPGPHAEIPGEPVRHSWQGDAGTAATPWLGDHQVHGLSVLPGAAYCALALTAAAQLFDGEGEVTALTFDELLHLDEHTELSMTVTPGGPDRARCEIYARGADGWTRHAGATVRPTQLPITDRPVPLVALAGDHSHRRNPVDLYESLRDRGIHHGPAFAALTDLHLSGDGRSVWAAITLPAAAAADPHGLAVHPVLIDACAQALMACLPANLDDPSGTGLILPVGMDRVRLAADPERVRYCHGRLERDEAGSLVGHLRLLDAGGNVVGLIDGLRLIHHDVAHGTSEPGRQRGLETSEAWLYGLEWHPSLASTRTDPVGGWLVLTEPPERSVPAGGTDPAEVLGNALRACGADPQLGVLPGPGETPDGWARSFARSWDLVDHPRRIVVLLPARRDSDRDTGIPVTVLAQQRTQALLTLIQALTELPGSAPRIQVITQGAQALSHNSSPDLQLGGIRGLLRVIALEHPEFQISHLDADPADDITQNATGLAEELLNATDDEVALRAGLRFVARLAPAPVTADERRSSHHRPVRYGHDGFALRAPDSGNLDDLRAFATPRRAPGPGQVEIRVQAAGMNFRDVLISLGVLPIGPIGFESAGIVTAVGPGVSEPSVGDQVLAVDLTGGGAFGSFMTTQAALTMPVPAGVDPVTAAGIPAVFVTAWYALKDVAKLRAGERVLIHSGTGGTGLAAIAIARALGAEVLATAGNPAKRAYLQGMGIRHVMDSRSVDFAEQTLDATGGQGVDVVLNSLSGHAIRAGLDCLRPFGRFVELGLRDILADSPLGMLPFRKNITFTSVNLIELYRNRPGRVAEILRELSKAFTAKELTPVPVQSYPLESATEAFRFMAGGTHVGKIVLTVPEHAATSAYLADGPPSPVRPDGAYLITGGLGGVGLETAGWLASHRAGRVVLNGRSAPGPEVSQRLSDLAATGTEIELVLGDIAEPGVAERLVKACQESGFELAGVVHAAMVLDDATAVNTTADLFGRVWRPKVEGAWRLHEATADLKLDWFALYSSMSSMLGNPGQSAYAAANSWLDMFADWRSAQGLPSTAINWGPWGEVGAATDFADRGYATIGISEGLHALQTLLVHGRRRAGVLPGDPSTWIPAAGRSSSLFSDLISSAGADSVEIDKEASPADLRGQLRATAPGLPRRAAFEAYVTEHLSAVLRLQQASLDPDTPLRSLGFDSLLALELRSRLEPGLGIKLPGNFIWKYPTLATLAAGLADYAELPLDQELAAEGREGALGLSPLATRQPNDVGAEV